MKLTLAKVAQDPSLATHSFEVNGQEFVFRPLTTEDVSMLTEFLTGLSAESRRLSTFDGYDRITAQALIDAINRYDKLRFCIQDGSRMVGLIEFSFGLPQEDIDRFAMAGIKLSENSDCRFGPTLADDYQDRGIGSKLFPLVTQVARAFGKSRIILWGGVLLDNPRAIRYYEKLGFKHVSEFVGSDGVKSMDMIFELSDQPV